MHHDSLPPPPSADVVVDVKSALAVLHDAAVLLQQGGSCNADLLLPAYRAVAPVSHVDIDAPLSFAFLQQVLAMGGLPLLQHAHLSLEHGSPRAFPTFTSGAGVAHLTAPPSLERTADGLALALGVALEAQKARRLLGDLPFADLAFPAQRLGVDVDGLQQAFGGVALDALNGLVRHPQRQVHGAPIAAAEAGVVDDFPQVDFKQGPVFVVAGATGRMHDLLSPLVRKLHADLAQLAQSQDDDALYEVLPAVFADDAGVFAERNTEERSRGFAPFAGGVVVEFARCVPQDADRRAHGLVQTLKQNKAVLVVIEQHPQLLRSVLQHVGPLCRALILLSEGMCSDDAVLFPEAALDVVTGRRTELRNAMLKEEERQTQPLFDVHTLPSLGFAPLAPPARTALDVVTGPFLQAVFDARVAGDLDRGCRVGLGVCPFAASARLSELSLKVLAKMAAAPVRASRQAPPLKTPPLHGLRG